MMKTLHNLTETTSVRVLKALAIGGDMRDYNNDKQRTDRENNPINLKETY